MTSEELKSLRMYGRNNKVPVHLYRIPGASETNMVVLQKVLQDYRGNANIKGEFGNILSDSFVIATQHATVHTPCETWTVSEIQYIKSTSKRTNIVTY